jgi:hypothetical protein
LPGEIWTIPAERKYASYASGQVIEYVLLYVNPNAKNQLQSSILTKQEIPAWNK